MKNLLPTHPTTISISVTPYHLTEYKYFFKIVKKKRQKEKDFKKSEFFFFYSVPQFSDSDNCILPN